MKNEIKVGDVVKFSNPNTEEGEESLRFVVIEDRRERLLVSEATRKHGVIAPTFVYSRKELELA